MRGPGRDQTISPKGWEKQWDEKLPAANREGKVVVYSSGNPETRSALANGVAKSEAGR